MHRHPHPIRCALLLCAAALAALHAHAGTIADGAWRPAGCGSKPEAPALNLKDVDAFNSSIDGVTAYRKNMQAYIACLTQEANADIQAITSSANATQLAAKEANEKIQADVKTANEKFK